MFAYYKEMLPHKLEVVSCDYGACELTACVSIQGASGTHGPQSKIRAHAVQGACACCAVLSPLRHGCDPGESADPRASQLVLRYGLPSSFDLSAAVQQAQEARQKREVDEGAGHEEPA